MSDESGAYAYMLRCADGSCYVGTARLGLDQRVGEHNAGVYGGYTSRGDYGDIQRLAKRKT